MTTEGYDPAKKAEERRAFIDDRYEDDAVTSSLMEYLENPLNLNARDNFAKVVFDISKRWSATTAAESLRVTASEMRLEDEMAKLEERMSRKLDQGIEFRVKGDLPIRGDA